MMLKLNVKSTTVHSLENKFLKGILHMVAPDVMISLTGNIVISSEEGETSGKYQFRIFLISASSLFQS